MSISKPACTSVACLGCRVYGYIKLSIFCEEGSIRIDFSIAAHTSV